MKRAAVLSLLTWIAACGGETAADGYPQHLSEWGLFSDAARQIPVPGVVPYEVNAALFQDHALKYRFIRLPEGGTIGYEDDALWRFPVGSVLVKTFAFPADFRAVDENVRILETRLLIREAEGWNFQVYLWNDEQTEARRIVAGARVPVSFVDAAGAERAFTYVVPDRNQCASCHGGTDDVDVLGPRTRQMDRAYDFGAGPVNQIDELARRGMFDRMPPPAAARTAMPDPFGEAPLEVRARAYLDANCAHCHRRGGSADSSGLWLDWETERAADLGVCRRPVAAGAGTGGHRFDILPGDPDRSIMVFRMESTDPEIKMPELPAVTSDEDGVALIRAWIAAMAPGPCSVD